MSTGLASAKVATYSTLPRAFFGARPRSWTIALCGSFGSISPCTLPRMTSYGPALPAACPSFIGSREVISSRTTCARAAPAPNARRPASRKEPIRVDFIDRPSWNASTRSLRSPALFRPGPQLGGGRAFGHHGEVALHRVSTDDERVVLPRLARRRDETG